MRASAARLSALAIHRACSQPAKSGRLWVAEDFRPTFGFIYSHAATLRPKRFRAYRIRRPERPPAGTIACTKRQSPGASCRPPGQAEACPTLD